MKQIETVGNRTRHLCSDSRVNWLPYHRPSRLETRTCFIRQESGLQHARSSSLPRSLLASPFRLPTEMASLAELNREKNRRARECWEPGSAASDGDDDATGMKSAKYAAGQQPSRPSDGRSEVRVHIQSTPSDGRFRKWKLNNFTCFDFPSSGGAGGRHTDGAEAKT